MKPIDLKCTFKPEDTIYLSDFTDLVLIPSIYVTVTEGLNQTQVELRQEEVEALNRWTTVWLAERYAEEAK